MDSDRRQGRLEGLIGGEDATLFQVTLEPITMDRYHGGPSAEGGWGLIFAEQRGGGVCSAGNNYRMES